jgi:hypothetical protein
MVWDTQEKFDAGMARIQEARAKDPGRPFRPDQFHPVAPLALPKLPFDRIPFQLIGPHQLPLSRINLLLRPSQPQPR